MKALLYEEEKLFENSETKNQILISQVDRERDAQRMCV